MPFLALLSLFAQLTNQTLSRVEHQVFDVPGGGRIVYAIAIPGAYDPQRPRPLVLALHPGGDRRAGDGGRFMRQIVLTALKELDPIVVAPDCPTRSWTDPEAEAAVMALLGKLLGEYAIDRHRVLVTGFSLGGRGTWFMASRHADLFTGAIPMAASTGNEPIDQLGRIPTYIIHSRDDNVAPFAPAERVARELETQGRTVKFEALEGIGHYQMGGYVNSLKRAAQWIAARWSE